MDTKFENQIEKIIDALKTKAGDFECPVCKKKNFNLNAGYFAHDLQTDLKQRIMGGINIPTVPVVCSNCGLLLEFAAGTLGLLPEELSKEEVEAPEVKANDAK